ncbi:sensor histidine kinase [Nocardioides sp. URHA0032]|uniref:sensor histidine kinase n=1 Tax=Nocardioides sp. URHA0032 TaxID=1380388 RepID=UPI00048EC7F9|nr:HAMP domain-containing sensor histidine kinase [Nocardioides sp. URHA0032]
MTVFPPAGPDGRWHYRRSLASRVTVLTTIAAGATVLLVAFGAYLTVRMQLQATLDDSLVQRATQAAKSQALAEITSDCEIPTWALGAADVRIAFIQVGATPAVRTCSTTKSSDDQLELGQQEVDVATGDAHESIRTIYAAGQAFRVVTVPTQQPGQALVVAQSLESQEKVLRKLGIVMFLFGLAGVIASGMAGWAVARNGLRPVRRLTASVEEVARTEDLRPMPVEGDDEIARLTAAFNQMLAALAASRDRQRQLVADAGHELRTPLTSLRTNLDLLSQADSSGGLPPGAKEELLDDVRAQIEEMTTLIGDLVELSRDEPLTHVVEEVDLADLVDRTVGRVRRRAPGTTFDVDLEPWFVVGEQAGIERAVTNLLDNAAKWSPTGGTVTVRMADGTLVVDDEGPGIGPEDLPHVFDRFYRSEESRSMPGSGLGLSIVRQVASRHSGTVEASTSPSGGARMTLWLPGSIAPVPDWTPAS